MLACHLNSDEDLPLSTTYQLPQPIHLLRSSHGWQRRRWSQISRPVEQFRVSGREQVESRLASYHNHGVEELLHKDGMPWYTTLDLKLIARVLLLQLGNLCRGESILNIGVESCCYIGRSEKEGVPVEGTGHSCCRWFYLMTMDTQRVLCKIFPIEYGGRRV